MNLRVRKPLSNKWLCLYIRRVAYALQSHSAMRGLDPTELSRCALVPAKAASPTLPATSVSRGKSRLPRRFLTVDLPAASRYSQRVRAGFFCGKVVRFDYPADGVGLLQTPLGQSTAIQTCHSGWAQTMRQRRQERSSRTLFRWECTREVLKGNPVRWATDGSRVRGSSEMRRAAVRWCSVARSRTRPT
jgi:hypothetical protein